MNIINWYILLVLNMPYIWYYTALHILPILDFELLLCFGAPPVCRFLAWCMPTQLAGYILTNMFERCNDVIKIHLAPAHLFSNFPAISHNPNYLATIPWHPKDSQKCLHGHTHICSRTVLHPNVQWCGDMLKLCTHAEKAFGADATNP